MEKTVYGMAAEIVDDKMYFACQYDNALYVYDFATCEIHFKKYFFHEYKIATLYYKAYVYERSIFFIPWEASNIAIYDVDTNDMSYIEKPIGLTKTETVRVGNAVYLLPIEGTSIFILDLEGRSVTRYQLDGKESLIDYKHRRFATVNDEILCLPGKENVLYGIDLKLGRINSHEMPFNVEKYSIHATWGDKKAFVPFSLEDGLVIYDSKLNQYEMMNFGKRAENVCCVASLLIKDELLLLPVYGHIAYVISLSSNFITQIDLKAENGNVSSDLGFQNIIRYKNTYYAVSDRNPIMLEISEYDAHAIKLIHWQYKNNDIKLRISEIVDHGKESVSFEEKSEVMFEGQYELEELFLRMYHRNL